MLRSKFVKFLISILKRQVDFSPNFVSLFSFMKDSSSVYTFLAQTVYTLLKRHPLTLFRIGGMGGRVQKGPPRSTRFSPVTSTNVGISTQNFQTLSFNPFALLVWNFKFEPSVSPKLSNLNQDYPSKKWFFRSNPYEIEVMISSPTEMLELPNFFHMTTSTI